MTTQQGLGLNKLFGDFDKALVVASHFGFTPVCAPKITREDEEVTRSCIPHPHYNAVEKAAVIRTYLKSGLSSEPHPLALAYRRPRSISTKTGSGGYSLHFIGSNSGIAEGLLMRSALSILSEVGFKTLSVDINCIGDRESMNIYERELVNHLKKYGNDLSPELKQNLKADIFNIFRSNAVELERLREIMPPSISFLSAPSRLYFKEVLEYLEALGVNFRFAPELIGERHHVSHTIFAIKDAESQSVLAVGYRYSRLSRLLGLRKEMPLAGATIFTASKNPEERIYKDLPRPKFYLVQLGKEARIKALYLLEYLRSHRIHVRHFIGRDKIAAQMTHAEELGVPYLIIIGQKEALDNTATIRNVATRAQDTVSMAELPHYLKNLAF